MPHRRERAPPLGVDCQVQAALAAIRTDLDSFTDREAYALMASGYRATERSLGRIPAFTDLPDHREQWRFLALEPDLQSGAAAYPTTLEQLKVGAKLALKVWSLDPVLRALRWVLLALAVGLALWGAVEHPTSIVSIGINSKGKPPALPGDSQRLTYAAIVGGRVGVVES